MPLEANTRITLSASSPKTKAVIGDVGTAPVGDEVSIWAALNVDLSNGQAVVGAFQDLLDYAKSNMPAIAAAGDGSTAVQLHKRVAFGDRDIDIDGIPTAEEVRLDIGPDVYSGQKSHLLNRTVARLIELWLEEYKTGYTA
jgi:hypothetical protein